jgi:hypothetical protein
VRKISQENDSLKEELAQLRKDNEEKKVSGEVLAQVLNVEETAKTENLVASPPVYERDINENNNVPIAPDDMAIVGHVDDLDTVNNNCSIS